MKKDSEKLKATQRKVIKWAISTIVPSVLIFFSTQIVSSWNLSRVVRKIEQSEMIMISYNKNFEQWPTDEPSQLEADDRLRSKYYSEVFGWVSGTIAPEAEKHLARLEKNTIELEAMRLWTWDDSIGLARNAYLRHAQAWQDLMISHSECSSLQCLEVSSGDLSEEIKNSFISAKMEFDRISPRFDLFGAEETIASIFSDEVEE